MEDTAVGKLNKIKKHLEMTLSHEMPSDFHGTPWQEPKEIQKDQKRSGHKVGIFSLDDIDVRWLQTAMESKFFSGLVEQIKYRNFQNEKKLKERIAKSTFCIFCSDNKKDVSSPREKKDVMRFFVGKPLIVVLSGVDDSSDTEKRKILKNLEFFHQGARDLILFNKSEKEYISNCRALAADPNTRKCSPGHLCLVRRAKPAALPPSAAPSAALPPPAALPPSAATPAVPPAAFPPPATSSAIPIKPKQPIFPPVPREETNLWGPDIWNQLQSQTENKKQTVGIFSRSAQEDFSWMTKLLTLEHFRDCILSVEPCYISNRGFQPFIDAVGRCTLAILYHTKNRGRINITNVTDSLYDWELEYLHKMLGRDNVVVVIDDLEDASNAEKRRIQENQPGIGKWASHLLLMSRSDKADSATLLKKFKKIKQFQISSDYNWGDNNHQPFKKAKRATTPAIKPSTGLKTSSVKIPAFSSRYASGLDIQTSSDMNPVSPSRYTPGPVLQSSGGMDPHSPPRDTQKLDSSPSGGKNSAYYQPLTIELHTTYKYTTLPVPSLFPVSNPTYGQLSPSRHYQPPPLPLKKSQIEHKKQKVGIFSRSAQEDYSWMTKLLTSEHFRNRILSVEPCYISNRGFQQFIDAVGRCTLAILYHTKNRGRINITNVTDSLYDWELEYLQKILGRNNVMVVIDDLEDSSEAEKRRILENQPGIWRSAGHLLLVSRSDKDDSATLLKKFKCV